MTYGLARQKRCWFHRKGGIGWKISFQIPKCELVYIVQPSQSRITEWVSDMDRMEWSNSQRPGTLHSHSMGLCAVCVGMSVQPLSLPRRVKDLTLQYLLSSWAERTCLDKLSLSLSVCLCVSALSHTGPGQKTGFQINWKEMDRRAFSITSGGVSPPRQQSEVVQRSV